MYRARAREARWDVVPLTGSANPGRMDNPVIRFIRSQLK
jgi:hypothetical protein